MRRISKTSSNKPSGGDSQRLAALAQGTAQASSRLEERHWERSLDALLHKLLKTGHQDTIDAVLEQLFKSDLIAYDLLMETVEAASESCVLEHEGVTYDTLLIAAPILAWTRFSIPSGAINEEMRNTLSAHLYAHLLADNVRMAMAPTLFSVDQLPRTHAEAFTLTQRLAQAALKNSSVRPAAHAPETVPFLADTRYLIAAVVVRSGEPLFRWQASLAPTERAQALAQWRSQAGPNVVSLLPGCGVELLMPEAYYTACREADKQIRPASIKAAVHYLTNTLDVEANGLRAIIGGFSEDPVAGRIDEYRIGFTLRQTSEVVYGVVWPLYGQEDEEETVSTTLETVMAPATEAEEMLTPIEEIVGLLRSCGITHIKRHNQHFPMEFCDDCGSPLYPAPDAELVHAEMPEDTPSSSGHFH